MTQNKHGAKKTMAKQLLKYGGAEGLRKEMQRRRSLVKNFKPYFNSENSQKANKLRWERYYAQKEKDGKGKN